MWTVPVALVAMAGLLVSTGAEAFGAPVHVVAAPKAAQVPAVRGVKNLPSRYAAAPKEPAAFKPTRASWPAASSSTVVLGTARAAAAASPVWGRAAAAAVAGPKSLHVQVLDHAKADAAGIPGVLLQVSADQPGKAQVGVDYSSFAQAYGGNFGHRLRL